MAAYETLIRLSMFLGVLIAMAVWEVFRPRPLVGSSLRDLSGPTRGRHREMTIGLREYLDFEKLTFRHLLRMPFLRPIGSYSFRRE